MFLFFSSIYVHHCRSLQLSNYVSSIHFTQAKVNEIKHDVWLSLNASLYVNDNIHYPCQLRNHAFSSCPFPNSPGLTWCLQFALSQILTDTHRSSYDSRILLDPLLSSQSLNRDLNRGHVRLGSSALFVIIVQWLIFPVCLIWIQMSLYSWVSLLIQVNYSRCQQIGV
jgi:hypothetical protein